MLGRNKVTESFNNACGCCNKDSCFSLPRGINCSSQVNDVNNTCFECQDMFQSGKCLVYRNNVSKPSGDICSSLDLNNGSCLNYHAEICDPPTNNNGNYLNAGEVTGIVLGAASFVATLVGLFIARKQLRIAYKDYKQKNNKRRESIELREQINQ